MRAAALLAALLAAATAAHAQTAQRKPQPGAQQRQVTEGR